MKRIEILIDEQGHSQIETRGFAGRECLAASEFLERALGNRTAQHKTPEFYATCQQVNPQRQQSG